MGIKDESEDRDVVGLSPEELAAMAEDTDTDLLDDIIDDDDGEDDEDDDTDAGDDAAAAAAAAAGDDAADADDEGDDDDDTADDEDDEPAQAMHVAPVENFDARMQEFVTKKAELRQKLNDGDIDMEQYEAGKDALVAQETDLKNAQRDFTNEVRRREAEGMDTWNKQQKRFFKDDANAIYKGNHLLNVALDTAVKDIARDPANSKRSGAWILAEADKQVRAAMGMGKAPAAKVDAAKPAKPNGRKPDLSGIPKTLANLPAAEQTETGDNEFAYLEKLEGMELEGALAKMSRDPAKEARYLRQS